jgi:hypothetical protein
LIAIPSQADSSVVCTELFNQGRLGLTEYLVDAGFGARLASTDPQALQGYQLLATPVVSLMKRSQAVTDLVESMVRPVLKEMATQEGHVPKDSQKTSSTVYSYWSAIPKFVLRNGITLCSMIGRLHSWFYNVLSTIGQSFSIF